MIRYSYFVGLILFCVAVATALRVPQLADRPMHGDEAVHTVKFETLWQTGEYTYDPSDYHGPTLYYATLPIVWLSGAAGLAETSEVTFRIVPVLFGVALVLAVALLGDGLGRSAVVYAAMLTAVSPTMTYYSRYYIQESLLALFTFVAILAGWRYTQARSRPRMKAEPQDLGGAGAGMPIGCVGTAAQDAVSRLKYRATCVMWALAVGACLGLMYATKETSVLAFGAMAVALFGTIAWHRRDGRWIQNAKYAIGGTSVAAAFVMAVAVSVLLYSNFFRNPQGPVDSVRALGMYFQRAGGADLHEQPWYYYINLLLYTHHRTGPIWSEALIVVLATIGVIAALAGKAGSDANKSLVRFIALYAIVMTIVYSAIPYKTPWCVIAFLHPLILMAGIGVTILTRCVRAKSVRVIGCCLLAAGAADLGRQAHAASLRFAADNRNPYAYAHPLRGVQRLGDWVERLAEVHPDGRRMVVKVIAPDPWPLPWYLRRLERVGYWEHVPNEPEAPVIIVAAELQAALNKVVDGGPDAYHISYYGQRPSVQLAVYVDRRLWEMFVGFERTRDGARGGAKSR